MVRRFLFENGFAEDADLRTTDLAILFTCAFCQSRVADMLGELERIRATAREDCEVIVGSCLPVTDPAALKKVFDGKTVSPTDFSALNDLAGVAVKIEEVQGLFQNNGACIQLARRSPTDADRRVGVFISSGCLRKCSYCAIRFATGPLRSKPPEAVSRTLSEGWDQGHRKFEIYADSIGDYGLDIGSNLGMLCERILESDRDFSVGIYDLHPQAFIKFFEPVFSLCRAGRVHYLYVPLQSGSARVLKLMNRSCNVNALVEKLLEVRVLEGVFLQTSIIVGFPTETDEEFDETLDVLRLVQFNDVYVHCYSEMPNTESAKLPGKIDKDVMLRRLDRLDRVGIRHNYGKARHEWENFPLVTVEPASSEPRA